MAKAIALRVDHSADDLRRLARAARDAAQTRRLLALAAIYDGASRREAARIGVGFPIVRDWVIGPTAGTMLRHSPPRSNSWHGDQMPPRKLARPSLRAERFPSGERRCSPDLPPRSMSPSRR